MFEKEADEVDRIRLIGDEGKIGLVVEWPEGVSCVVEGES
jgi:hypothetical protein